MAFITNLEELRAYFGPSVTLIGDLPVDVVSEYRVIYEYDITRHPVEKNFDTTDSRVLKPIGLSLDCLFTDPDFSAREAGKAALSGNLNLDTWLDKKSKLEAYRDSEEVITVVTEYDTFESMVVERFAVDRSASKANALFVIVDFRVINIVESQTVNVDPSQIPKSKKKKKKQNQKNKDKDKKAKEAKGKKRPKSFLKSLFS